MTISRSRLHDIASQRDRRPGVHVFRHAYFLTHGCFLVLFWSLRHFGFGFAENVAATDVEPVIVSWQSPLPEQPPLHATKRLRAAGFAESVTVEPRK